MFESTQNEAGHAVFKLSGEGPGSGKGYGTNEKQAAKFWINDRNSIPGFLCSLWLEQYESATRGGKHAGFVSSQ